MPSFSDLSIVEHEHPFRYEEDGLTVTRGSAWSGGPGCHLGCGVLMYSDKEGKVVHVEGDPDNPYNQGRLCVRCLAMPESINHEGRLLFPMKRAYEDRGKMAFERISWDEALDTIEERFNYYRENFGAESVSFWQGTGRDIAAYITRLAWSFGSPNYTFNIAQHSCYVPRILSMNFLTGNFWVGDFSQQFVDRYDNPEWKCPECVIVWGNDPLVANSDGAYGHWVTDVMQRGAKIIVIDPRLTWLASKAEIWLQVRPGTDCAVALAMAHIMIEEDLYDKEFVEAWAYGFDAYADHVSTCTAEWAAEIAQIDAEDLIAATRMFANAERGLIQWGVSLDQRDNCLENSRAITSLLILTGNFNKPGTMIKPPEMLTYITGWGREFLTPEQTEKMIGSDYSPIIKAACGSAGNAQILEALMTGKPYPIKACWMQTVNVLANGMVDLETTKKAFLCSEFNVVVDMFMTPTVVALADIVLPCAMFPERNGIRVGDGCQRGETINKAVEPAGECRSDQEICLTLGKRFAPEAWPWENVEEMYSYIMSETGKSFEEIREIAPAYLPFKYGTHATGELRPDGKVGFKTQTGRLELWQPFFASLGYSPMPVYEEPAISPISRPDLAKDFPFVLTTGARTWGLFHSEQRQIPHLRAIQPEPTIQMNPKVVEQLGLQAGQWVWVEGPLGDGRTGRAKRVVEPFPGIKENVMNTGCGWWHPEADPEKLYDSFELNINNLFTLKECETGYGSRFKSTLCRVYPVQEGE